MANERNKILPYALSAIEGVNIQSQEDYSASLETTDGVSTGLANGNNFNKLAKQVSIMSSSLAEFIVNTLAEQTISDTNSIEEISSSLNSAILKLIKDNEPVIPDKAGITVIDDNNTDITSFNQITKDGIYYIYKQLSDGPSQNGEAIKYNFIHLIVINVSIAAQNLEGCLQMTSFGLLPEVIIPGNIGTMPMLRSYNKTSKQWEDWASTFGIPFINNNILISDFTLDKLHTKFPIIATDNTFPNGSNTFMYSATKEQMRVKLGITDPQDLTDYFNKKTDKLDLATQVTGQLKNANIADNAITTSKIASLAITADKLASSSVTNDKIANGAVTSEKIASKTITASNIAENAITQSELASNAVTKDKISNGAVTDAKFSGALSVAKGGTGRNDGLARGIKNGVLRTQDTWQTDNTQGTDVFYWQIAEFASKGLPYTAGALISNVFTSTLKGFMALDLSPVNPGLSLRVNNTGDWKRLAFIDEVPTVLKYENSDGIWTETKLSDGTTMLEGLCSGKLLPNSQNVSITFPKNLRKLNTNTHVYCYVNSLIGTPESLMKTNANVTQYKNYMTLIFDASFSNNEYAVCIKGILA